MLCGNPKDAAVGATFHPETSDNGWFVCPDNITFDPAGRLWVATDGANDFDLPDGIYGVDTEGPARGLPKLLFTCPHGAEATGPCFTPDGKTLFLSVQHPAEDAETLDKVETLWPDFKDGQPPRPSVVAISRKDGAGDRRVNRTQRRKSPWCCRSPLGDGCLRERRAHAGPEIPARGRSIRLPSSRAGVPPAWRSRSHGLIRPRLRQAQVKLAFLDKRRTLMVLVDGVSAAPGVRRDHVERQLGHRPEHFLAFGRIGLFGGDHVVDHGADRQRAGREACGKRVERAGLHVDGDHAMLPQPGKALQPVGMVEDVAGGRAPDDVIELQRRGPLGGKAKQREVGAWRIVEGPKSCRLIALSLLAACEIDDAAQLQLLGQPAASADADQRLAR